ncbi:MAG: ATP-binding protein [Eubacterium sp.]|nr:ATP-binding protein [Eubacterium sp.]
MTLSAIQYREIMDQYDMIRRVNYEAGVERRDRIYAEIPEIRQIDETIASESVEAARKMLFQPDKEQREKLHVRIASLSGRKKELLAEHGYSPDYLEPVYVCPHCQDTGYVGDRKCICFKQRIKEIISRQSNLTEEIGNQNFDTFRMDCYSTEIPPGKNLSPRDNMKNILDQVCRFIRSFEDKPGQNLLITGHSGVGKTFLSTCIAGELIRAGKSVIYLTAYQLFEQLADQAFHRGSEGEDILSRIRETDLLIIDDLGTELNNSFVSSRLFLCINERILSKKSTIINTNYSLKKISQTYSERIFSRLIQFYTILNIYGEDIRIKKAFSSIDGK